MDAADEEDKILPLTTAMLREILTLFTAACVGRGVGAALNRVGMMQFRAPGVCQTQVHENVERMFTSA